MKNVLIILIFVCVGFVSCDGRKSQSESLKESIEEFKDSVGPIEIIKYIPEDYAENVTDTILSNGFRIHIKTFSDMENGIVDSISMKDSITTKTIKRDFISVVTVYKNDKKVFSNIINKSTFYNQYDYHKVGLNKMILKVVRVNQLPDYPDIEVNKALIEFHYCNTDESEYYRYLLEVLPNGEFGISNFEY